MNLRSFDYLSDTPAEHGGLTRIATLIRTLRKECEERGDVVVTFDNGDSLQGAPIGDLANTDLSQPHIFYRALQNIGYDAAGLGNHDFNAGLSTLSVSLAAAPLPVLCTNARRIDGQELPVQKWTILDRQLDGAPLKIGVFSLLPPQTLIWDADHLSGRLVIEDITASARAAIVELQDNGADLIICLAHSGLGDIEEISGQENALWPLSNLPGLDAIIAGHTHLLLPDATAPVGSARARGILRGTPVVMPGAGGTHLGVIDLELERGETGWKIRDAHPKLHLTRAPEDPELLDMTRALHDTTRSHLAQTVGRSPAPLHSYFDHIAPSPALAIVAAAKQYGLQKILPAAADLPILASVAPGKLGGRGGPGNYVDIPAGQLCLRHIHDLCFFPNRLAAVIVTGAQLADWLEMSAGIYNQLVQGTSDQFLIDPAYPPNGSDIIYGIECELDLSQPPRFDHQGELVSHNNHRVTKITFRGRTVHTQDRFLVALSSHRANGGGNVSVLNVAEHIEIPYVLIRDILSDYLNAGQFPDWAYDHAIRLKPLDQTEVLVRTGPGAMRFLHEVDHMSAEVRGTDEDGFLTLQLAL